MNDEHAELFYHAFCKSAIKKRGVKKRLLNCSYSSEGYPGDCLF